MAPTICLISILYLACGSPPRFDGRRAYADLVTICSFGPRVADTESHQTAGRFLFENLKETTDICRMQYFTIFDSVALVERKMFNIISSYYPEMKTRVLLCAHWDSRPYADKDPDSSNYTRPVPGANDGASGAALLLEIARLLKDNRPPVGVDIALFDGEDYGTAEWPGGWFMGSRQFVSSTPEYRPRAAILVDMIGDSDLKIHKEAISQIYAPDLNDYIWETAKAVGAGSFVDGVRDTVADDHVPLLAAGIKAVDIIDFDYPYWHTVQDTPDKCSPESLEEVGRVITAALFDRRMTRF